MWKACYRENSVDGWLQTRVWRSTSPAPPAAKAGEAPLGEGAVVMSGAHHNRTPAKGGADLATRTMETHPDRAQLLTRLYWKTVPSLGSIHGVVRELGRLKSSCPEVKHPVVRPTTPSPAARREQVARGQAQKGHQSDHGPGKSP